jgi:hypothetical protein
MSAILHGASSGVRRVRLFVPRRAPIPADRRGPVGQRKACRRRILHDTVAINEINARREVVRLVASPILS